MAFTFNETSAKATSNTGIRSGDTVPEDLDQCHRHHWVWIDDLGSSFANPQTPATFKLAVDRPYLSAIEGHLTAWLSAPFQYQSLSSVFGAVFQLERSIGVAVAIYATKHIILCMDRGIPPQWPSHELIVPS